jgi:hypothetical protein
MYFGENMRKEQMTVGTHWLTASLRMCVDRDGDRLTNSCLMEIANNLLNTLNSKNLYPEVDIFITRDVLPNSTTIAISFVPKKIQEKSGAT